MHTERHTQRPQQGVRKVAEFWENGKMLNEGGEKSVVPGSAALLTRKRPSVCLMRQAKERVGSWNFRRKAGHPG